MNDCRRCAHALTRFIRNPGHEVGTTTMKHCAPGARVKLASRLRLETKKFAGEVRCRHGMWKKASGVDKTYRSVASFCMYERPEARDCPHYDGASSPRPAQDKRFGRG